MMLPAGVGRARWTSSQLARHDPGWLQGVPRDVVTASDKTTGGEAWVARGTIPKELVDGLAVELHVEGHRVLRTGKSSPG